MKDDRFRGRFAALAFAVGAMSSAAVAGSVPAADAGGGTQAWMAGQFDRAVALWRKALADRGPGATEAAYGLGLAYHFGHGVVRDPGQAVAMLRRAASAGHPAATEQLALILAERHETREEALRLLDRAARMGRPLSQYLMGLAFADGDRVKVDRPLAVALLTRAAAGGIAQAASLRDSVRRSLTPAERVQADRLALILTDRVVASPGPLRVGARQGRLKPTPVLTTARTPGWVSGKSGRWGMQLGAYAEAGGARRAWSDMIGRFSDLRGHRPTYVRAGDIVRLRVTDWTRRGEAETLCRHIRDAGRPCFFLTDGGAG